MLKSQWRPYPEAWQLLHRQREPRKLVLVTKHYDQVQKNKMK